MKPKRVDPNLLRRARELRRQATDAETLLWRLLRNRQVGGHKFRRQHPVEIGDKRYVLDFYCREIRFAVELDGGQHNEEARREADERRTTALQAQGVTVMRFWNDQVLTETEDVMEALWETALTLTLSQRERGR